MPDDRLRHALSEETHERIFRQAIVPDLLPLSDPLAAPVAVILGGQPGAGKTALLNQAAGDLTRLGPTVVINGDDFRSYHPRYADLQRSDPLDAARYTDHDSGGWVEKLIAAAQERRVNLVIESTMRRPEVFDRTAGQLHAAGYSVEARAMAVPERLSWQGVHQRYEAMLAQGSAARFTARDAHDAGAAGMLQTLRQVERDRSADRVLIATRDERVLYDNRLVDGIWQSQPAAAASVELERSRPRTPAELGRIEQGWTEVIDSMQRRRAPGEDLARVVNQAADDVLHFGASPGAAQPLVDLRQRATGAQLLAGAIHDKSLQTGVALPRATAAAGGGGSSAPGAVPFGSRIRERQARQAAPPPAGPAEPAPSPPEEAPPAPRRPGPGVS